MHFCTIRNQRSPINCIIPPYMLNQIAQNGTPDQQTWAQQTQATTTLLRQERVATAERVAKGEVPGGEVSMSASQGKQRFVYTADYSSTLPGRLLRQEGQPASGDAAADEAYDGAGYTYDLYWTAFQRDSIDNRGMAIRSTIHYQRSYDNAFWNGQQMVYGDGDEDLPAAQRIFNRFTIALDVIGHELTHGVTQYEANLTYSGQSGALNESMSDVFGSLVKQYQRKQDARSADWIIGEGLFTPNVNGVGIRSMKAPGTAYNDPVLGKDPQPATMSGYVNTAQDNGGVHINSGIPSHAFYVAAYEMGGYAWEKAGQIWYAALRGRLSASSNFQNAADVTYTIAGEMYGVNGAEQQAVKKGWAEVGITVAGNTGTTPGTSGKGCLPTLMALFRPSGK